MIDASWMQSTPMEFALAALIGLLLGRTREKSGGDHRAGLRDFVIIAITGGIAATAGNIWIVVTLAAAVTAALLVMRATSPERGGITTELAGIATFGLGYLALTQHTALAAALGIGMALLLSEKAQLHRFTLRVISADEFTDTLKFLALIFVILPLLPEGRFGPFEFFEPRKIWLFVILVSGVAYVGYFIDRFVSGTWGLMLGALVGGLASSTAHMTLMARSAREHEDLASSLPTAVMVANGVMYLRMLVVAALISPPLALAVLVPLGAMTIVSLAVAGILHFGDRQTDEPPSGAIGNPFALLPALKFGAAFALITFLAHVGDHYFGQESRIVTAFLGGFIDVNAALVSLSELIGPQEVAGIGPAIVVATAANAIFRFGIAFGSRVPAFWLRVLVGYVVTTAAGFVMVYFAPPI